MRQVTEAAAVAAGKSKMPSLIHNDTYMIGPGRELPYTRVLFVKTTWAVLPKNPNRQNAHALHEPDFSYRKRKTCSVMSLH